MGFRGDLFESLLDPQLFQLPRELAIIDRLLDDERYLEPIRRKLTATRGRPTIPLETYLRMMYLKRRYDLGFEALVKEVADSLVWRSFCRLNLTDKVPDASTLIKLTHRLGPEVFEELHKTLMGHRVEQRVIKQRSPRIRVDTTVVRAHVHYPTDAGLLADGVRVLTRLVRRAKEAGIGLRIAARNRLRSVRRRLQRIHRVLRRGGEKARMPAMRTRWTARVNRLEAATGARPGNGVRAFPSSPWPASGPAARTRGCSAFRRARLRAGNPGNRREW